MSKDAFLLVQSFISSRHSWEDIANIRTQFLQYTESVENQSNSAIQRLSRIKVELELARETGVHPNIICLPDSTVVKSPLEVLLAYYNQVLSKRKEILKVRHTIQLVFAIVLGSSVQMRMVRGWMRKAFACSIALLLYCYITYLEKQLHKAEQQQIQVKDTLERVIALDTMMKDAKTVTDSSNKERSADGVPFRVRAQGLLMQVDHLIQIYLAANEKALEYIPLTVLK